MKIILSIVAAAVLAAPLTASAQYRPRPYTTASDEPAVSPRAFFLFTEEQFTAQQTFKAAFGKAMQPFVGGGAGLVFRGGLSIDFTISRFDKTGTRAFFLNGQVFPTGIALAVTLNALEGDVGYRFKVSRHPFIVPFIAAGVGQYHYKESSPDDVGGEGVDATHLGYLANGGVELRLQKWVGVSVDAQYTHITGILGAGGVSQQANENDLGGIAARFRVIVGR